MYSVLAGLWFCEGQKCGVCSNKPNAKIKSRFFIYIFTFIYFYYLFHFIFVFWSELSSLSLLWNHQTNQDRLRRYFGWNDRISVDRCKWGVGDEGGQCHLPFLRLLFFISMRSNRITCNGITLTQLYSAAIDLTGSEAVASATNSINGLMKRGNRTATAVIPRGHTPVQIFIEIEAGTRPELEQKAELEPPETCGGAE